MKCIKPSRQQKNFLGIITTFLLTVTHIVTFQVVVLFAQAEGIRILPAERKAAEGVTAKQLSDYLYFVASDEMEGRDTPSRGLDTVAKFIGMNLSKWGFKPAGDNGTFFQKIALRSTDTNTETTKLQIGSATYKVMDDFLRLSGNRSVEAPLVFAHHGWMVKSKNIDAYKGIDVTGKIVVVYGPGPLRFSGTSMPAGVTQADLTGTRGTDWADSVTYARNSGAKGVIVIASPENRTVAMWNSLRDFLSRPNAYPEKMLPPEPAGASDFPVMLVSERVGDAIFAGESATKDSANAFAMTKSASMHANAPAVTKWTQNVVALWEGSDPKLKSEMVAIGAHYDHIGITPNVNGPDKINNGADDDGSGTVAVLAIAEALSKAPQRPKRSVLFVWHCGEEKGLWGSEYFNKYPTIDIKQVVAQLNVDMIGRSKKPGNVDPKDKDLIAEGGMYVIGKDMMSSKLGSVVDGVNKGYLNLTYNTRYDDPKDTNRFFFRSDHANYAANGIPVAFWFNGPHVDYHQVGDEPEKIDYVNMEKVARTIYLTLTKLADLNERPKVDKKLPPELLRRN
jgi:Zn-dependent M28 family amino/carboxypeptidase